MSDLSVYHKIGMLEEKENQLRALGKEIEELKQKISSSLPKERAYKDWIYGCYVKNEGIIVYIINSLNHIRIDLTVDVALQFSKFIREALPPAPTPVCSVRCFRLLDCGGGIERKDRGLLLSGVHNVLGRKFVMVLWDGATEPKVEMAEDIKLEFPLRDKLLEIGSKVELKKEFLDQLTEEK